MATSEKQIVLLVEDEPENRNAVKRVLRNDSLLFLEAENGVEALKLIASNRIDLILLDIGMPIMDGYTFLEHFRNIRHQDSTPVCIMTAWSDDENRQKSIELGADDFVGKPVNNIELITRVKSLLRISAYQKKINTINKDLEKRVKERTFHLQQTLEKLQEAEQQNKVAYKETVEHLGLAAEYKDKCTANHLQRMSEYSVLLARKVGWGEEQLDMLLDASKLHDIGKIGIPDAILMKPAKLTAEEYRIIQTHTGIGAAILTNSQSNLLQMAEIIALTHHECYDGSGYPKGLQGKEIPEVGRIVAIADVFDALISTRPYKSSWSIEKVLEVMNQSADRHFDKEFLALFFEDMESLIEIHHTYPG